MSEVHTRWTLETDQIQEEEENPKDIWRVYTTIPESGHWASMATCVQIDIEIDQLDADILMGQLRDGIYNEDDEPWWVILGDQGMIPSDKVLAVIRLPKSKEWMGLGAIVGKSYSHGAIIDDLVPSTTPSSATTTSDTASEES